MNRDGFRGSRIDAQHEAAHAVIAVLSGWCVARITIAPSRAERRERSVHGLADVYSPRKGAPCAVPLSPTADIDVSAAGLAWEWLRSSEASAVTGAWRASEGDREGFALPAFLTAVARVEQTLKRPDVARAVRIIADTLQSRKGGEIFGTTIERIICRHVPAYGAAHAAVAADLAAWVTAWEAERIALWNAARAAEQASRPTDARQSEHLTRITVGGYSMPIHVAAPPKPGGDRSRRPRDPNGSEPVVRTLAGAR
jgi:hypothetical protein